MVNIRHETSGLLMSIKISFLSLSLSLSLSVFFCDFFFEDLMNFYFEMIFD